MALTIALVLGGVAHGQPPTYELRTMLLDPAASTDETHQFGMSKLRAPYLCSHCGYSSMTPGDCPNPFGVAGHPATELVPAARAHDRVLDVARALRDGADPTADIRYEDTAGVERFLSVIGRPFHPARETEAPGGSNVFAQFAWPNRPAGWGDARVHFVTLPPGVKEPHAYRRHEYPSDDDRLVGSIAARYGTATTANIPVWIGDPVQWYEYGATVSHADEPNWFYWCREDHATNPLLNRPGSGTDWRRYWYRYDLRYYSASRYLGANTWEAGTAYTVDHEVVHEEQRKYRAYVCVQNHTAADGNRPGTGANWMDYWEHRDLCDVRLNPHRAADGDKQYIRYYTYDDGTNYVWRLLVYSRMYGLEFDSGPQSGEPPSGTGIRLVTASGAVIMELGVKPDPAPGNNIAAAWQIVYDTHSNTFSSPPPSDADSIVAPNVTGPADIYADPLTGWEGAGEYYAFAGTDVVANQDPYALKPGEVGVGRVQLRWRSEADLPDEPDYSAGAGTYYYSDTEWWYDPGVGPLNSALATLSENFDEEYQPIESRFLASRYHVPPTGDNYRHGAVEPNPGIGGGSGYARIIAGRRVADMGGDRLARAGETATRRDGLRVRNMLTQGDEYYRCPVCGATFTEPQDRGEGWPDDDHYPEDEGWGVCPYHGDHSRNPDGSGPEADKPEYYAPGPRTGLERVLPGGRRVFDGIVRSLTVPEIGDGGLPWLEAFPTQRPQIPDEAVQITRQGQYVPLGAEDYPGLERALAIGVPRYQPASEPGQAPGNEVERNWGYRGMGVTFHDTIANVTEFELTDTVGLPNWATGQNYSVGDEVAYDGRAYRCIRAHRSNNGRRPDRDGGARVWVLAGEWRTTTVVEENARWDVYLECPDCGMPHEQPPAALAPGDELPCTNQYCPGHEWCPVCGSVYMLGMSRCPFDGAELEPMQPADVDHRHLAAEEYAPYDVEVAVLKSTELVADAQPADGGRVAPGIDPDEPDRTVTAAGGTPEGRRADPAGVSYVGRTAVRNEGNTIPLVSGIDDALYRLFRPEADQLGRGFGWAGVRDPVAGELIHEYHGDTGLPLWGGEWRLASPPAGAAAGTSAGVLAQLGGAGDIVGTGQVLGRYSGPLVYYLDINGNGVFDFETFGGTPLNSAVAVFDPERHVALEPYVLSQARVRVSEAPFPFNSYVAQDVAPTPRFDYNNDGDPVRLEVMWMTNRDLGNPGVPPSTDAAVNLVYQRAAAAGWGENRTYEWDPSGGPGELTADTGPLAQSGPVDVYADGVDAGANLFALWHSTYRGAGGLASVVRSDWTQASNPVWTGSAPDEFLWVGRDRAEGVRGFFDPDVGYGAMPVHWAFWHAGQRGQERLMFAAWQPDGSAPGGKRIVRGGVLPVDNAIAPADPRDYAQTSWDDDCIGPLAKEPIGVQKFPRGPFAAVKDVSPVLYLPPVVYGEKQDWDPSVDESATRPQIRVFFAGKARHRNSFDIYEARFNRTDLLMGASNDGKLAFPRTHSHVAQGGPENLPPMNPSVVEADEPGPPSHPGEEFTPDARRQEFHSRHLDWATPHGAPWQAGAQYAAGDTVTHRGRAYNCEQGHTASGDTEPGAGANWQDVWERQRQMVSLRLGVKLQGVPRHIHYYDVSWGITDYARGEGYDRRRGVYVAIPRFQRHDDDEEFDELPLWPAGPAGPVAASQVRPFELIEPETVRLPDREKRPIKMEIDPVLGRVRFSAPLFNPDNPADESAVLNSSVYSQLRNPDGSSRVVDVFLCGDYSPFVWRHTISPANDDNPTAIMMRGAWHGNQRAVAHDYPWPLHSHNQGLMLFWRRSYGSGQAPYYGRTSYMMKHESRTIRTNHAPMENLISVEATGPAIPQRELFGPGMPTEVMERIEDEDFPNLPDRNEFDVDFANGEIAVWPGTFRWVEYPSGDVRRSHVTTVEVTYEYVDAGGVTRTATETHSIGGWSEETVLPIDTVLSEGPLRVAEETFRTPARPDAPDPFVVGRRYWVFWTSARPIYDLRAAGDGGSVVRQSSNIYYSAVTPEHPTLLRHRRASSNAPDLFRPPF